MQHVSTITDGRVVMGPGTLYGALNALVKKQWITTTPDTSTRKKDYVISKSGRQAFQEEHQRLEKLVADGKEVLK
jgi:DNA-binding PadR family transcriptional regulator